MCPVMSHAGVLGQFEIIPAQLILVSIGYKSLAVPGLPFDARSGTVPNQKGKVLSTQQVGEGQVDGRWTAVDAHSGYRFFNAFS